MKITKKQLDRMNRAAKLCGKETRIDIVGNEIFITDMKQVFCLSGVDEEAPSYWEHLNTIDGKKSFFFDSKEVEAKLVLAHCNGKNEIKEIFLEIKPGVLNVIESEFFDFPIATGAEYIRIDGNKLLRVVKLIKGTFQLFYKEGAFEQIIIQINDMTYYLMPLNAQGEFKKYLEEKGKY